MGGILAGGSSSSGELRQLHGYTPGYQWSYPHPYLEETHTRGHGYGYSHRLRKMDLHPYPEDTHTHSHGYGYGHRLRKVDLGYDPPWVIPAGISLDDADELGRKTAIPGDHHKCQGWCQMDGAMSSACCDLKQSRNGVGDPKSDQEAMDTLSVIGVAQTMLKVLDMMGDGARWMVQ